MRHRKFLLLGSVAALGINLLWAGAALGQTSNQSSVNVTRSGGSLSFSSLPQTFDFGSMRTPSVRTPAFTNPLVGVWNTNILGVQDTRDSGGFTVTVSANGNFTETSGGVIPISNTAPNDNLRIVTSPPQGTAGTTTNGVLYDSSFVGPQTVSAPLNVAVTGATVFGQTSTFLNVANNILDTTMPVLVLDGSLSGTDGRIGQMKTGVASMLYIPAFLGSGQYTTVLVWTLADSTI